MATARWEEEPSRHRFRWSIRPTAKTMSAVSRGAITEPIRIPRLQSGDRNKHRRRAAVPRTARGGRRAASSTLAGATQTIAGLPRDLGLLPRCDSGAATAAESITPAIIAINDRRAAVAESPENDPRGQNKGMTGVVRGSKRSITPCQQHQKTSKSD